MADINIRFTNNLKNLDKQARESKKNLKDLGGSAKACGGSFAKAYVNTKKFNDGLKNINTDATTSKRSLDNLGNSMRQLKQLMGMGMFVGLGNQLGGFINSAMDMIETTNLFSVSMGSMAVESQKTVEQLSKITHLDMTNMQDGIGTFALLARSMGMTSDMASDLAMNTYQLAVDLSSLTNVPINQVVRDLRSGLLGQSETVYKYGVDVTEASLASEALAQGISKSVRNMSQGEKMALRYNVMIRQTTLAQGDFARTLESPANQARILHELLTTLSRTIGTVFIPMLTVVLPYINAFVMCLNDLISAFAKLVGYKAPKVMDMSNQFTGMEDFSDATDKATGGVKKLKKEMKDMKAPFDELNTFNDKSADNGGAGASGLGGASILDGMDLLNPFKGLGDVITQRSEELKNKMMPILQLILKTVTLIAVGFASWKIGTGIMAGATALSKLLAGTGASKFFSAFAGGFLVLAGGLVTLKGIKEILETSGTSWKAYGTAMLGVGIIAGGVALLLSPIAGLVALIAGAVIVTGIQAFAYATGEAVKPVNVFADGVDKLTGKIVTISDKTKEAVEPFLEEWNRLDAQTTSLDWSNKIITQEDIDSISETLRTVTSTIVASFEDAKKRAIDTFAPLKESLGEDFAKITESVSKSYDDRKKAVEDGEKRIQQILANAKNDPKGARALTQAESDEIAKIQENMKTTGITFLSESMAESKVILQNMRDNAKNLTLEQASEVIKNAKLAKEETIKQAEEQYNNILIEAEKMKDAGLITDGEYRKIRESAKTTKDQTVADANEQFNNIKSTAETKLGATSKYIDLESGNIKTRWQVFTSEFHKNWDDSWNGLITTTTTKYEDIKKYIDTKSGDIKTNWKTFTDEFSKNWNDSWDGLKKGAEDGWNNVTKWYDDKVSKYFTKDHWVKCFNGIQLGMESVFKSAIKSVTSMVNTLIDWLNEKFTLSFDGYEKNGLKIPAFSLTLFSIPRLPDFFANGGFPDMGQMFIAREAGPELVGNIGGRSAVANNDQIVEAVSIGVAKAVQSVLGSGGNSGSQPIVIELDGKVLYSNQQKVARNVGTSFGMGAFAK